MAQADIESWILATEQDEDTDDFDGAGGALHMESALEDWPMYVKAAQRTLMGSRINARTRLLKDRLVPLAKYPDLKTSQALNIFQLLTVVYPRYIDKYSRDSSILVLEAVLSRKDDALHEKVVSWIYDEVDRLCKQASPGSIAPANLFVLMEWCYTVYVSSVKSSSFIQSTSWRKVVDSVALLLNSILHPDTHTKTSLVKGAIAIVRRAVRSNRETILPLLNTCVDQAKSSPSLIHLPLIGLVCDVINHLKPVPRRDPIQVPDLLRKDILRIYASHVIMSKVSVPRHVSIALQGFVKTYVSNHDLSDIIIPTLEKAILRSPENALQVAADFFGAYPTRMPSPEYRRVLQILLNTARSSNPAVRSNTVATFRSISKLGFADSDAEFSVSEFIMPLKSGKSASPDHRIALYTMLASVPPSTKASIIAVESLPSILIKETNDLATPSVATALKDHLLFTVHGDISLSETVLSTLTKETSSTKPAVRRAIGSLVGHVLWNCRNSEEAGPENLAKRLLPPFEANLKATIANPVNSPSGTLDSYVALACMLGPMSRWTQTAPAILKSPAISAISATSTAKPFFLVWERVYSKVRDAKEETWLLRALSAIITSKVTDFGKNETLRVQVGLAFLHLVVSSQHLDSRRLAVSILEGHSREAPQLIIGMVKSSLLSWISRSASTPNGINDHSEDGSMTRNSDRLSALLLACVNFDDNLAVETKHALLGELVILSHHPKICGRSQQLWIDLCRRASVDPQDVIGSQLDKLVETVLLTTASLAPLDAEAGFRTATTLGFVAPRIVLPKILKQIEEDLAPKKLQTLSATEMGIWKTPEGSLFVDVLASKKALQGEKKGKNAAIEKWEAELRSSLASKKASATTASLSKQDRELVDAQLKKERAIRAHVEALVAGIGRGLGLVRSLIDARVDDLHGYMSTLVSLLLSGVLQPGTSLVAKEAFDTYIRLSECTSDRLQSHRLWIGIATLRSLNVESVPEDYQVESLESLVLRVLYRLHSLSQQLPFDGATFSYSMPLMTSVVFKDRQQSGEESQELEAIALVLDIMKHHTAEFGDSSFPRTAAMEALLHVIAKHPTLAQEASSSLVALGQAIYASAKPQDVDLLLRSTLVQEVYVRSSCLQCLQPFDLTDNDWSAILWLACHDSDDNNARLAIHVWEDNGLDVAEEYLTDLQPFLGHDVLYVRSSCSLAIADAAEHWPETVEGVVMALREFYLEKAKVSGPEYDEYGILIPESVSRTDPWMTRLAIAETLEQLAPLFPETLVEPFFAFLIDSSALGDQNAEVRRGLLRAGARVIDLHGTKRLQSLINMFEKHLSSTTPPTDTADFVKEAVVIFLGRVSGHMNSGDDRIPGVVKRLKEALKTPSEQVQVAVSECLAPLVKLMRPSVRELADELFEQLFNAAKYGERRGAAYGLAGVIKGLGISAMPELEVTDRLEKAVEDKKRYEPRQGAMFAFETLSATLGRNFEPYIIQLLPVLLASFGDANAEVREATQDAAKVIMSNLSGFGVKRILPTLLAGLDEKQWRTKKGSIELLGTMAFCSPKQLSVSLPTVIPQLTGVLTDSHAQVRAAANKSLKQFGEVINNPEIQALTSALLKALVDPAKISNALNSLLKTAFIHYIDAPSLALLMPILERGLKERSADSKRKAARIVGNLASLTDANDFLPYLSQLLPLVHVVLADPVPEARATAAKALGTLVERLGEARFPDMVSDLMRTLKSDLSGVDRQGAAQGLSEVLAGLGLERLEALLPDIVSNAQSSRSTVRESFMSLLVYLPATFGARFQPHLPRIVPPILSGLSDNEEYVREAAMRAGRMIITNYSNKAIDLLLPKLEEGMFDPSWRIRHSSITLVGELVFKVSGITGKAEIEEDEENVDVVVVEGSRKALTEVLGKERRDSVLSSLFLIRQDSVNVVRQAAIHIWKALVHNTPRTVRELLPELISQIIYHLSNGVSESEETAARTMGELCRKFGERMLGEIIPILGSKSTSSDPATREGVSLALYELMESASDTQREDHDDEIIEMVRAALVDDEASVRTAAARAFDQLQEHLGVKAIDRTIPTLLEALRQPGASSGTALQALREVMGVRANTVFPVLIPTLTAIPMTAFNARALASLVSVAGSALSKRITAILTPLVKSIETNLEEDVRGAIDEAVRALMASISDAEGLNTLMLLLLEWAKANTISRRISACKLFATFCEESDLDDSMYRIDWIRTLVGLLDDSVEGVHKAAWEALDTFVKSVPKDELEDLVIPLRRTIESSSHRVPGFALPKGVAPLVPVIIAGLTTGTNEQREQAAYAIGDLVERTDEIAIKPFVVPFTGPLIRVATQATAYPPNVKSGLLSALTTMLVKIPVFVKPFFPQLQRTFVKMVTDPSSLAVRNRAAVALGVLMKSQPRVDPLVTELITTARNSEEAISASVVGALANVVQAASSNMGDNAKEACVELITETFREPHDDSYIQAVASLFASLAVYPDILNPIVQSNLVAGTPTSSLSSRIVLAVLTPEDLPMFDFLDEEQARASADLFERLGVLPDVATKVQQCVADERPSVARPAREAKEKLSRFI